MYEVVYSDILSHGIGFIECLNLENLGLVDHRPMVAKYSLIYG